MEHDRAECYYLEGSKHSATRLAAVTIFAVLVASVVAALFFGYYAMKLDESHQQELNRVAKEVYTLKVEVNYLKHQNQELEQVNQSLSSTY